ncbi:MAG TPA: hypothetical protein VLH79_03165 [Chthonomonadales bacterium]|nr:hypothetical protein [Chthonomonadales bacterium]
MASLIDKYLRHEVEVLYLTDTATYRDRGQLTDAGDGWLELTKPSGETFAVPMTAVRLLKVIGTPNPEATRLLRPATDRQDEQEQRKG